MFEERGNDSKAAHQLNGSTRRLDAWLGRPRKSEGGLPELSGFVSTVGADQSPLQGQADRFAPVGKA